MPPYATHQEDHFESKVVLSFHPLDPLLNVPNAIGSNKMAPSGTSSNTNSMEHPVTAMSSLDSEDTSSSSVLERLLDFNPCMGMMGKRRNSSADAGEEEPKNKAAFSFSNPYSAIFKDRRCSECGGKCTKLKGYSKVIVANHMFEEGTSRELPIEESSSTKKIYLHKWCSQLRDYRNEHKEGFNGVLCQLMDYFRALELEAQMKREAELRRKQEEVARDTIDNSQIDRNLAEGQKKNATKGFLKRVKKSGKRIQKSFSMNACMGINRSKSAHNTTAITSAVDESAFSRREI